MYLRSLYLRSFRNYEEAYFEFDPHINIICGPNAKGKTSLLEAVYFLVCGRSFRNASVSELIRHGSEYFHLQACFVKNGIEQILKMTCDGSDRKVVYNSTSLPSAACLLGVLKGVVLCPDDAALVKGAPALRRQFLDLQIAQVDPLYVHYLTRYNRAMRQRNCLLKSKHAAGMETWEQEMANSAAYVCRQRQAASHDLQDNCRRLHATLTGDAAQLSLNYKSSLPSELHLESLSARFAETLAKNRRREMDLGFTFTGPHKDDLMIAIDAKDARFFASEGQQRTSTAALRFAEWERLHSLADEKPMMLIDDVGISLDEQRKARLLSHAASLGQVMLSSTQALDMPGRHIEV